MQTSYPLRQQWLGNLRGDLLSGIVVALALIPEAIAFSLIAGVDPRSGCTRRSPLPSSPPSPAARNDLRRHRCDGAGDGRPGQGPRPAVPVRRQHPGRLLLAGVFKLGSLMRFVSRSVITGFVNALAILIFLAQMPELIGRGPTVYVLCAAALAIIYLLPRITRAVPSPLVAIVVLTAVVIGFGIDVRSVGDMGQLPDSLPHFLIPDVPLTWETLRILLPVSATLAVVGLLESMMTLQIVEDITETPSERNRECVGQGVANTVTGFLGGMAGCAMIGQSVINVTSGGRRLSCLVAGVFLLVMVVYGSDLVRQIPMAALVAVMIMVSIGTFSWRSLRDLRTHPRSSSAVMLLTVVVTVATHDLAKGVLSGVLLSALLFARKVGHMLDVQRDDAGGTQVYRVRGQVFFASAGQLGAAFDYQHVAPKVQIDLRDAHLWDLTAVAALERAQESWPRTVRR